MLRCLFACFTALSLISSTSLLAQTTWRSSLYPENWTPPHELPKSERPHFLTDAFLQDFSFAGYHKGEKPIPSPDLPIFNVVSDFHADPSGETDSTAAIQSAIDAAAKNGGGIVYLPAGSYRLSCPEKADTCLRIDSSNIVLRGAGTDRTYLFNTSTEMRSAEIIRVRDSDWGSWSTKEPKTILLTEDELGPTTELTLASENGLSVNDWIIVHNPPSDSFITELRMDQGSDGVSWLPYKDRVGGPRYLRQITAIDHSSNTITIDIPTRWQLTTRDGACIYKAPPRLTEVGLEHFSIGNKSIHGEGWEELDWNNPEKAAYQAHDSFTIELYGVLNSWIQNVHSYNPGNPTKANFLSNGVKLEWSRNVTLDSLNFQYAQFGGGGGDGYAIRFNSAQECLLINSETGNCRHGIVMWMMTNSGNVVTQSFDHDNGIQFSDTEPTRTAGIGSDHHGIFSHSNLFDSNTVERSYFEAAYRGDWGWQPDHGNTSSQSVFWNTRGLAYNQRANYIVHSQQFGHGYVIGTQGPSSAINLTEKRKDSAERTEPIDHSEGIGAGETLSPKSLYADQLRQRLEK